MRRSGVAAAVAVALAAATTACGGDDGSPSSDVVAVPADPARVSGDITVLTNRTDQVQDGTLKKYADRFTEKYPGVTVKFQGITDYEGDVKTRMSTENYGDVLAIPNSVPLGQYPSFFAPLGTSAELSEKFNLTDHATVDGKVYGIAATNTADGFVYNKAVWKKAGITDWPTSPDDFLADLQAIKARTDAIPYYTNYKDKWPITNWTNAIGAPSCDAEAHDKLATTKEPWAAGQDLRVIDTLVHDIVSRKLSEPDPNTTNWESSKDLLATGKIATMELGSWAPVQMAAAATKAGLDPADIGFMPFPSRRDGQHCASVRPDYQLAVNTHSDHKEAARAWIDWFLTESGDAAAQQSISGVKGAPLPPFLQEWKAARVRLLEMTSTRTADVARIDKASEIGITSPDYRQRIVDVARGAAKGDLESVFAELNGKWSAAVETAGS